MPASAFHPVVQRWFASRFGAPTEPQALGWPAIASGRDTLIAAPTGSGKTLAAFLSALDQLFQRGFEGPLPDATTVLYISPLKALSNDVQKNLLGPLGEIRRAAVAEGLPDVEVRVALRTGDTPARERAAMLRRPPHVLVTTPESFYMLLTAERGREVLRTVRTVIVDEIHAVARDKRGSHLALSLERLTALTGVAPVRVGLSATQRPIQEIGRFLVGTRAVDPIVVDVGHHRQIDLAVEVPGSPLEAVMSHEVWEEVYGRLAALIEQHVTTLVFVNTRRLSERLGARLSERLGEDKVATHHGSLSKERRLDAEQRLKAGSLSVLVATSSLELGIDIGAVDLVCQIASPRALSALLQRVGRAGHFLGGIPKGRVFPLSRDDLVECTAHLEALRKGELDRLYIPLQPLDILAQQLVATTAADEWDEDALYELVRGAWPYRDLSRETYDEVLAMLTEGFSGRLGRRARWLHHDGVGRRVRARRGARMAAITSGGAIPDTADYRVILEPDETFVGTLHEDFAIESTAGDIFQLGNTSWRIRRVLPGQVRVEDARGAPPTIPFWLGEAPARTNEVSAAVSRVRRGVAERLDDPPAARAWLAGVAGLSPEAADQLVEYLGATRAALGVVPNDEQLVLERFFDEAGGMQLVLHAPFGGRINRAWGLALRKRFCRQFNFELQAAATEEGIVLSLGPQHSFPLDDVWRYLRTASARHVLEQALLPAPMFEARWRWNATRSLAILRQRHGKKVAPQLQRMIAGDLLAAVFPDQAACAENLAGEPVVPDHPLVRQTIDDCMTEATDADGLLAVLGRIERGELELLARDTTEPSPIAHEILGAKPYAFLDDAPLEERRTQAVLLRRSMDARSADDLGALDPAAIARVREEAWPDPESADELHDALLLAGCLPDAEIPLAWRPLLATLADGKRAGRFAWPAAAGGALWIAAERLPLAELAWPNAKVEPVLVAPARDRARTWERATVLRELVRGRCEIAGPVTAESVAAALGLSVGEVAGALGALEGEGFVLRGRFEAGGGPLQFCDRRLLARIHRYTLDRLRKEIEPVSPAELMRFLVSWQRAVPPHRARGVEGLAAVLALLDGCALPAAAWERDVLPVRLEEYDPRWLDALCLSGEYGWGRLAAPGDAPRRMGPLRSTPMAIFRRENEPAWRCLVAAPTEPPASLRPAATKVLAWLEQKGASFFHAVVSGTGLLRTEVENALGQLVAHGLVSCDGYSGLRALLTPTARRPALGAGQPRGHRRGLGGPYGVAGSGRWSRVASIGEGTEGVDGAAATATFARQLLRRYGVVFRKLLEREAIQIPWRELLSVLRPMEARGEIRGGRFVGGFSGEQYALPEAVGMLRQMRREDPRGELVAVSAADPLNLAGLITPGERITAHAHVRVLLRDGVPVAAQDGAEVTMLGPAGATATDERAVRMALAPRKVSPVLRTYLGV